MDASQVAECMRLTRRHFLELGLIAGAGATLASCTQDRLIRVFPPGSFSNERELIPARGLESWAPSVCTLCPAGCGIQIRRIGETPVGIRGTPEHPVNRGALCPRGLVGIQILTHPDRLRGPVRRVGERNENRWEPVNWDEALQIVSRRLQDLHAGGEFRRLALLMGATTPLTHMAFRLFANAFGTPNLFTLEGSMGQGPQDAFAVMHGTPSWQYDLAHADFVLGFGMDWLQTSPSPVEASRAYGYLRRGRAGQRVRIVQAESRLSVTGIKADTWIPVKPGTEGALALGIAHVLISEERYNKTFITQHTFGFEDWSDASGRHIGFKSLVLDAYNPAVVSEITGAPVETITQLAREFAAHTPAIAITDRGRLSDQMAVHSLNALVGNLGAPGGVVEKRLPPLSMPQPPEKEVNGVPFTLTGGETFPFMPHAAHHLPEVMLGETPYTLDTLMMYRANPVFTSPDSARWTRALEQTPFIITVSSFLDESALFADLILPEHAPLEGWQDAPVSTLDGVPVYGIGQPAITPLYDTRHAGDLLLELTRAIGQPMTEALPWQTFSDMLRDSVRGIYASGVGETIRPKDDEFWDDDEEETDPFESFWTDLSTSGGWTDRSRQGQPPPLRFRTKSGKFEFFLPQRVRQQPDTDMEILPHYAPPLFTGDETEFPLHLYVYTPLAFIDGEGAHLPFLQGIAGPHLKEQWETWVEINPETGERLGVHDRDPVWIESSIGRIKAIARWFTGAMPDVVNLPFGAGHTAQGRWAQGIGANPGAIVARTLDPITGHPLWQYTRVKLYRAEGGII